MVEIDPTTGLPEVPEGYFWRVRLERNTFMTHGILHVELRQHRKRFGTRRIWGDSRGVYGDVPVEILTRRLADSILRDRGDYITTEAALSNVVGDYPPKKLEVKNG